MSIEINQKFNQLVKRVEFFPFEWSASLLAVCFTDSVKIYTFVESSYFKKEESEISLQRRGDTQDYGKLNLTNSVSFQQKIEHFSWSPKTYISTLKPIINFAVSDSLQNVHFCTASLNPTANTTLDSDSLNSNVKIIKEKFDVDCIYNISFDHQNGELLALNADNHCYLWDLNECKVKAKFLLQSPGINICWNRNEKTKFMVGEKSGLIRIFSLDTFKPVYTIMCMNSIKKAMSMPLLAFDWCQLNPEVIVAITNSEMFIWNTFKSCLPEKSIDNNYDELKAVKLCQFKENIVGFLEGHDACSKLTISNLETNQTLFQSKNMKLLNSFSFNSVLPIVAMSNEQQITITKIVG